jgi:WD40 repeat protein
MLLAPNWFAFCFGCQLFIRWHPFVGEEFAISSSTSIPCANLLAAASDDGSIVLYDTRRIEDDKIFKPGKCAAMTLNGHKSQVSCLDWSPFVPHLLLSGSFDRTVQLWSLLDGNVKKLGNFRGHVGRVFCVLWSQTDKDIFFSGSDDQTCRVRLLSLKAFRAQCVLLNGAVL